MSSAISLSSPCMSDNTLLLSVESLINIAFGVPDTNSVDFKLIQTILHILARQMRILERKVVLVGGDLPSLELPRRDSLKGQRASKVSESKAFVVEEEDEDELSPLGRRSPPKFKTEAERLSWEKKEDERILKAKERKSRRSRRESLSDQDGTDEARHKSRRARSSQDEDEEHGGGHGRSRRDRGGRDDDEGGQGKSPRGRSGRDDDDDGGQGKSPRGRSGRDDDEDGGQIKSRRGRDSRDDDDGGQVRSRRRRDSRDDDDGGRGTSRRRRDSRDDEDRGQVKSRRRRDSRDDEDGGKLKSRRGRGSRDRDDAEEWGSEERGGGGRRRRDERRGSIAVVTQSQFRLLEEAVQELQGAAGPLPAPTLPGNKQLRKDLAAGASLPDTMQAMQVDARVKAAEQAIGRLGGLLTQLAASGALPPGAASAAMAGGWDDGAPPLDLSTMTDAAHTAAKGMMTGAVHVTEPEMGEALKELKDELTHELQTQLERAASAAEAAEKTAKAVDGKVDELMKMESRISNMYAMVDDYAVQLGGFDAGFTTQMKSFKEQVSTIRADLNTGMVQLEAATNNAETTAVMELNERFEGLVNGLEDTVLLHCSLANTQHALTVELKSLVESVEMLREQKADRDEMLDGLRDKADNSRLEGLVTQQEFDRAFVELEQRVTLCRERFQLQDDVWHQAVKDLNDIASTKAQIVDLMKIRDLATAQVRDIDEKINRLSIILGQPKAAMLMRKLSRNAVCGACLVPAMMAMGGEGLPPRLPAAYPPPPAEPCAPEPRAPPLPDFRTHHCKRFVGGSHTLLPAARAHAEPAPAPPGYTKKFTGYGSDGRLYWLEAEMEACVECNPEPPPPNSSPTPTQAVPDTSMCPEGATGAGDADRPKE